MITPKLYRCPNGHELRTYGVGPYCDRDDCHSRMTEVRQPLVSGKSTGADLHEAISGKLNALKDAPARQGAALRETAVQSPV